MCRMRLKRFQFEWKLVGGRERMLVGLALVLSIALMAAGCAGPLGQSMRAGPGPQVAAASPLAPSPRPDLDSLMYAGGGTPPAAVVSPIAAAAPAAETAVYLLDSGDRLRVVVFGQDGLS